MKNATVVACVLLCSSAQVYAQQTEEAKITGAGMMQLRTAIYTVEDMDLARAWYSQVLGYPPYFDEPFYVGFDVGGFELGLTPSEGDMKPGIGGTLVYWGVADAEAALARLVEVGATVRDPVQKVGVGIRTATVLDPFGNVFGIIENPHFRLPTQ